MLLITDEHVHAKDLVTLQSADIGIFCFLQDKVVAQHRAVRPAQAPFLGVAGLHPSRAAAAAIGCRSRAAGPSGTRHYDLRRLERCPALHMADAYMHADGWDSRHGMSGGRMGASLLPRLSAHHSPPRPKRCLRCTGLTIVLSAV